MSRPARYLLDADTFIRSKRQHYAFDICPGFWASLLFSHQQGRLISIHPVRDELLRGGDDLTEWCRAGVPESFFEPAQYPDVQRAYAQVIAWADAHGQYTRAAKQEFASVADPWLVAFASASGCELVTYEVAAPMSRASIKLPDAAAAFEVTCLPPYEMLRRLGVRFLLEGTGG